MTNRNLLVLALRMASIFLGLSVLENFPQQYALYLTSNSEYSSDLFSFVRHIAPYLVSTLLSVLLWFFPNMIISAVVPDSAIKKDEPEYFNNLNLVLVPCLGIYMIAYGIVDLAYFYVLKQEMASRFQENLQPENYAGLIATIIQIAIGVVLILGNKGLDILITRIHNK